jgi:hypothetical protein
MLYAKMRIDGVFNDERKPYHLPDAEIPNHSSFKDERVLYKVPNSEIPDRSWGGEPGIVLEVNDRTINVYLKAFIATKNEKIPGNKNSYFRDDVIQAWTRTY